MYLHIRIVTAKPHTKITIVLLDKDFIFLEIITTPMLVFDTASKKRSSRNTLDMQKQL